MFFQERGELAVAPDQGILGTASHIDRGYLDAGFFQIEILLLGINIRRQHLIGVAEDIEHHLRRDRAGKLRTYTGVLADDQPRRQRDAGAEAPGISQSCVQGSETSHREPSDDRVLTGHLDTERIPDILGQLAPDILAPVRPGVAFVKIKRVSDGRHEYVQIEAYRHLLSQSAVQPVRIRPGQAVKQDKAIGFSVIMPELLNLLHRYVVCQSKGKICRKTKCKQVNKQNLTQMLGNKFDLRFAKFSIIMNISASF